MNDEILTVKEAAQLLKVSVPTIYQLKSKNQIPYKKYGGNLRFSKQELINYQNK